jgi:hypothetical protein
MVSSNFKPIETSIEKDLAKHDYTSVFKELTQLRQLDKDENVFKADLKALNDQLHKDGYLPGLEIIEVPNGFDLQADGSAPPPDVTPPSPPPGGFDSGGGNSGSGGSGMGGSGGFGGDTGGSAAAGSSEGSGLPASGPDAFNNYDGNESDLSSNQSSAVDMAEQDLGKSMWTNFPAASAEEGCAASVSQVLDDAGVAHLTPGQGDALCSTMQSDLQKQGWTVTDKPQPGDVVIGYGGLSSAHTGIVGKNGTVYDNHSSTGKFSKDNLSYFSNWNKVVFLRPPDATSHTASSNQPATTAKGS